MRRAARISMYRGITHLRQIISSLNYIFPRRVPVAARVYFAFTSSIDENKNQISRPFSASPLHRLSGFSIVFRFMQITTVVHHEFLHMSREKCVSAKSGCF